MQCPQCSDPVSLGPAERGLEWVLKHRSWEARITARMKVDPWRDVPTYWARLQMEAWHKR